MNAPTIDRTKVYVVEELNSFDTGHIVGVFSTREAADAEAAKRQARRDDTVLVHEFTIDEPIR